MSKHYKALLGATIILHSLAAVTNASSMIPPGSYVGSLATAKDRLQTPAVILAGKKFIPSKTLKIGPQGEEKTMSKAQLRRENPAVYELYRKTERAAIHYQANRSGGVPLSCSITETYLNCQGETWFCTIWFDNLILSQCGPQPPSLPKS